MRAGFRDQITGVIPMSNSCANWVCLWLAACAFLGPVPAVFGADFTLDCDRAHAVSRGARGIALVVIHENEIVCELYSDGIEAEASWELASGVKSFTGMMAAAAVQDGLMTLDEPVAATLTEWQGNERRSRVTIRHLLSQTSGVAVRPNARRLSSYADAVRAPIVREPGERFAYGSRHFQIFGEVLRRKLEAAGLDQTPAHYFNRRILAPLGIQVSDWGAMDGMPVLSENAAMTPMGWARYGYLVAQGGLWRGQALADRATVEAQFQPTPAYPVYGLGWWLPHPSHATGSTAGPLDTVRAASDFPMVHIAAGAGGQRLYLLPTLDLVVVRMTRGVRADPASRAEAWSDRTFLEALLRPVAEAD
jgi:CubicO group peptidase (beta-lactamase class C family)